MVRHTDTRHRPISAYCPKYRIEGTILHDIDRGSQEQWECNTQTVNEPLINSGPQNLLSDALDIVLLQYPELNLGRRCRYNSGRLRKGQQAGKAWLGAHLDCITPIRFSVGGADKRATECGGSMSDQLTVFSRRAFVTVCKG